MMYMYIEIPSLVLCISKIPFSCQIIEAMTPHYSRSSFAKGEEDQALFS